MSRIRRAFSLLASLSFLLMIAFSTFPETVIGRFYLGDLPVPFFCAFVGMLLSSLGALSSSGSRSRVFAFGCVAALLMTLMGIFEQQELRWLAADLSVFLVFCAGALWGKSISREELFAHFSVWAVVILAMVWGSLFCLWLGWIDPQPVAKTGREVVFSLYAGAHFITFAAPVLTLQAALETRPRRAMRALQLALFCLATLAVTTVYTQTRTLVFTFLTATFLVLRIHVPRWKAMGLLRVGMILVPVLGILGIAILALEMNFALVSSFLDRLTNFDANHNERMVEIGLMFDQMTPESWWIGNGFGSRFDSTEALGVALAPHMGIFTTLYKGGFVIFTGFIVVPALLALKNIFSPNASPSQLLMASGTLLYMVISLISGGWFATEIFLFGLLASISNGRPSSELQAPMPLIVRRAPVS